MADQEMILNWDNPDDIKKGLLALVDAVNEIRVDAEKADCIANILQDDYFECIDADDPDSRAIIALGFRHARNEARVVSDYTLSLAEKTKELSRLLDDAVEQVHVPKVSA